MGRAEEVRASEGLNDLLCAQKSGPSPTPTRVCAAPRLRLSLFASTVKIKICSGFPLRQWPLVAQVIEVKFEKLDLEPDTYCRYDYVALFNGGETDNSRRIGKFCGDRAPG